MLTRRIPKLQPLEKPEHKKRLDTSLRILNLLDQLERKHTEHEGRAPAKAWRQSIGGVCLDKAGKRVTCIEIDGVQHTAHWLVHWLNNALATGKAHQ